ncbi:MAG: hypothetical protein A3H71_00055 [Candidatus Sungbacteria bacterium RIFCSPLOWO2_02_FULL_48_13b]|uniref:ArnT-like N-terminal domain-containing protein n=2 Tax=Candidatus Sungiibacteriota TaxID=1817917 RepID=A0A1G2LHC3_9BACT|nr:MAG: hypothetical protein A3C12_00425 [Candidatus Sungbacteria bacterium RIFCSPHIGHO2_02_FULL_49_20]OHA10232.1 MAG: hypothetical protein A3H71_00055 [Candidatus Sungbacteria bacterium RIFCSPLOWO2_02_FULL_48_13b]
MHYLFLALVVLLGAGLRLINIQAEPYWGDEVLSLDIATYVHPIGQLLDYIRAVEFHPPLYYIILQTWTHWFGTEPGAVRSLSLIFGVGVVLLGYAFVYELWRDRKAALIAALILAVLPIQIEYSHSARPYAIMEFLGLVAAYALWRYLRTRSWKFLTLYIIAGIFGLYIHYSFIFILAALGLWWGIELFIFGEKNSRPYAVTVWLGAHALVLVGFWYWLDAFFYKIILGQFEIAGLARNIDSLRPLVFFETAINQLLWVTKQETISSTPIFVAMIWKIVAIVFLALGAISTRLRLGSLKMRGGLFLLWLTLFPVTVFFFAPHSVYYTDIIWQHVIFSSIPLIALVTGLIVVLPWRRGVVLLLLFLISLVPFISNIVGNDADWHYQYQLQAMGEQVNQQFQPGDLVVVTYAFLRTDMTHFIRDEVPVAELKPIQYDATYDLWSTRHTLGFIANEYQSRVYSPTSGEVNEKLSRLIAEYHAKRVWLIGFSGKDQKVHGWFSARGWRPIFSSIGEVYLLDLYARDASTK